MQSSDKKATLNLNDSEAVELPIYKGSEGPDVVDIRTFYKSTGNFTFDPGFLSTASCASAITFINGEAGELRYRGYPIEQLSESCDYLEVCYLLFHGELPNSEQKSKFEEEIRANSKVDDSLHQVLKGFNKDAHPMAVLTSLVAAAAALYHEQIDINKKEDRTASAIRLIALMPSLVAMTYRHSKGEEFVEPDPKLSYAGNFLRQMFAKPGEDYKVSPVLERAVDRIFTLHADHEQNCSTSTVRLCGSSGTDPFAAISAGVGCLWGPAHGGANEACLNMLEHLEQNGGVEGVADFMEKVKNKEAGVRLMGFGHRVYKNYDPRAKIMQKTCKEVLPEVGVEDNTLFKLAMELERIALEDQYFVDRKLYPNVDFYSGIVQSAIGIPKQFFTTIFALARSSGWISQWNEMLEDEFYKIGRPRQLYIGETKRDVKK